MFDFEVFVPGEFSAEAEAVIAKYKKPQSQSTYYFDQLGRDLVDYLDKPELIKEIFIIVDNKYGSYTSVLPMVFHFADALKDNQIQKLGDSYIGSQLLDQIMSLLLNVNPYAAKLSDKTNGGNKFKQLFTKIQRNRIAQNNSNSKPYIGDIVPNNTGVSDRFGTGHDGSHIRSPKAGGNVVTIEALKGIVIRQYLQETVVISGVTTTLYAVWVLLKNGIVVVYKDLITVDAKLKKLELGKLYLLRNNPTSRMSVSTRDIIGTIRPWYEDDPTNGKNDVGLHLTFIYLKYINDYKTYLGKKNRTGPFPIEKLIAPCGGESPVKCI